MISMAITYPLVTVSTRQQVDKSTKSQLAVTKLIYESEGIAGFYSGIGSAMFGIAITQAVYYYWYELAKAKLQSNAQNLSILQNMLAGAIAGAATSIITNPIWVLNVD